MHLLFNYKFLVYYVIVLAFTYALVLVTNSESLGHAWMHMLLWFVVFIGAAITWSFKELNDRVTKLEAFIMMLLVRRTNDEENDHGTEDEQ